MPNAVWPGTLPAYVLEQGYSEGLAEQALETGMEAGRPKTRRRFTSDNDVFTVAIACTEAQKLAFDTFFKTTLKGGTLLFDWVHPVHRTAVTFRFRKPTPKWSARGVTHIVAFGLERTA